MNGRVYDPELGRFLSADPHVQSPANAQSLNRYSYALNNPLSYTDPSGYFFKKLFKKIVKGVKKLFKSKVFRVVAAIAGAWYVGGLASNWLGGMTVAGSCGVPVFTTTQIGIMSGAAAGFTGGIIASGGNLKAGVYGAVGGAMGGWVSSHYGSTYPLQRVAANTVVGGIQSRIQGGSFADGMRSSFGYSALAYLNVQMRKEMIAQSKLDPRNDGTGLSGGLFGDSFKLGGGRWDPFAAKQSVQCSPLGCLQSGKGSVMGIKYNRGSFIDMVVESFAGPHDKANSHWFYDSNGLIKDMTGVNVLAVDITTNYTTSLIFAAPFAAGAIYEQAGYGAYRKAYR
ncbi:MAG: RHS repeat-associated core domain-containing protein [Sedimenticola sp.]